MRNRAIKKTIQRQIAIAICSQNSQAESTLRKLAGEFGITFSERAIKMQVKSLLAIDCPF